RCTAHAIGCRRVRRLADRLFTRKGQTSPQLLYQILCTAGRCRASKDVEIRALQDDVDASFPEPVCICAVDVVYRTVRRHVCTDAADRGEECRGVALQMRRRIDRRAEQGPAAPDHIVEATALAVMDDLALHEQLAAERVVFETHARAESERW